MKMRIISITVIVLSLTVCGITATKIAARFAQLKNQLQHEATLRAVAESDLAQTTAQLKKTKATLKSTTETLESTQADKKTALANLAAQTKRAEKLATDLSDVRDDLAKAQTQLDQQTLELAKVSELQEALNTVKYEKTALIKSIASYKRTGHWPDDGDCGWYELPKNFSGRIAAIDPKWSFVVLDVGETQGAVADGEILINRNGKLVAKAKIRTVSETQSIANLMPGWSVGQVAEGDAVLAAAR